MKLPIEVTVDELMALITDEPSRLLMIANQLEGVLMRRGQVIVLHDGTRLDCMDITEIFPGDIITLNPGTG